MIFGNAIVLALGGLLVAVPIVLHFLMQPKPKTIAFPAIQFLQSQQVSNRRSLRLRHLWLLILRCLAIGLLALALAGPAVAEERFGQWLTFAAIAALLAVVLGLLVTAWLRVPRNSLFLGLLLTIALIYLGWLGVTYRNLVADDEAAPIGNTSAPVSAIIVMDVSPRMAYRRENQSHLHWAQRMADWVINQLPADSQIAVIGTDEVDPFFSIDAAAARKKISTLEVSYAPGNIPEALRRAVELFNESATEERREIYMITDLTKQSWAGTSPSILQDRLQTSQETSLFVIDVGTLNPTNYALSLPRFDATRLTQVSPLHVAVDLSRMGEAGERNIRLILEQPDDTRPVIRDGQVLVPDRYWQQTQQAAVGENGVSTVQFVYSDPLPQGILHGRLEILGQDALDVDDVRHFTLEVKPAWQVLVVHPAGVSSLFLTAIMAGEGDRQLGTSAFEITDIEQTEISRYDLAQFQAVFFLDPDPLSDVLWTKLKNYAIAGGSIGFFLGHRAVLRGEAAPEFKSPLAVEVMGAGLTRPWRQRDDELFISLDDVSHPLLAPFRQDTENIPWNRFPIYYYWGLEMEDPPTHPTQTILRFGNRQAALIERSLGQGRVLTMTTPISEPERPPQREKWNDLFTGMPVPAFLLISQTSQYLVQHERDTLNLESGQLAVLTNDLRTHPESYALFSPRVTQMPTNISANDGQLRYRFTDVPGQYRLKGNREGPVLRGFSVNLPLPVTDLTRIKLTELDTWLGAGQYQLAREQMEIQRQQGTTRRGKEFYPVIVVMLAILVGVEYLTSNRFYSRR